MTESLIDTSVRTPRVWSPMGDEAVAFLQEMLRAGPRLASEIEAERIVRDISERTLRRAQQVLGVKAAKRRGDGRFCWSLLDRENETTGSRRTDPLPDHTEIAQISDDACDLPTREPTNNQPAGSLPSSSSSTAGAPEAQPIVDPSRTSDADENGDDPPPPLTRSRWALYLEGRLAQRSDLSLERRRQIAADARALLNGHHQWLGRAHDIFGWRADALFRLCLAVNGGAVLELNGARALVRDGRGRRWRVPRVPSW